MDDSAHESENVGMEDRNPTSTDPLSLNPEAESHQVEPTLSPEESAPFIGQWNQLVSQTNWDKGRIIAEWRQAFIDKQSPAVEYSDEAWSRLVGGVTAQHVGRLRRVYQRFGDVYLQYAGLYWSHFHASIDWEDAEMWLEGAVQSGWSVSQMRRKRWETLGGDPSQTPRDEDIITTELNEDVEVADHSDPASRSVSGQFDEVHAGPRHEGPDFGDEDDRTSQKSAPSATESGASIYTEGESGDSIEFVRPFEDLGSLPDDLSDAFDAFKLAIIRHKSNEWNEISLEDLLACLDALKELAKAPSMGDAPF